jgi:polyhydroxybutyrate depolymerase
MCIFRSKSNVFTMKGKLLLLLSALLISASLPAQLITRNILVSGNTRTYDLELPSGWTQGSQLPLVLDLHYLGADARDEDTLTRFSPIADSENFIICHPWGQGTNWNVGFNAPYPAGARDIEFIQTVIDSIDSEFGVDRARVYATGMGQGGFMAHRLACELSAEIAAIACVGGSIADSAAFYCNPSRAIPVMIIHGTADSVVLYNDGNPGFWRSIPDVVQFWLDKNGCSSASPADQMLPDVVNEGSTITSHRYPCTSDSEVLLYEVVNGGFSWPGAVDSLPNNGITNMDINAAEEIWKFFSRWTIDGPVANDEVQAVQDISLWPNPVRDICTVALPRVKRGGSLGVVSAGGIEVVKQDLRAGMGDVVVEMSGMPSGIYFVILDVDGGRFLGKLVKE